MPVAAGCYYFAHNLENRSRPLVILIHGAGNTHLSWPADIRRLPGQRLLALDLPGHGKSGGLGRHSIADYARDLVNLMDTVGVYSAILIGHSMGGGIALQTALDHPERVIGLGLVGSNARLRVSPAILEALDNPAIIPQAVEAMVELSYGPQADASLKKLAERMLGEVRPAVLQGDLLACNAFDVIQRLPEIHKPTLIICGTLDQMTPLRYSEAMAAILPQAALQTIDGAGHMVMLEQPRRVANLLNVFINGIDYIPGRS